MWEKPKGIMTVNDDGSDHPIEGKPLGPEKTTPYEFSAAFKVSKTLSLA